MISDPSLTYHNLKRMYPTPEEVARLEEKVKCLEAKLKRRDAALRKLRQVKA